MAVGVAPPSSIVAIASAPPGARGLVLLTSLKLGTLYQVPLGEDGLPIEEDAMVLFQSTDRFREVSIHPNGDMLYIATDVGGYAMGPDGSPTTDLAHSGAILELSVED